MLNFSKFIRTFWITLAAPNFANAVENVALDEPILTGATIGTFTAVGATSYSLSANPGNVFAINTATGQITAAADIDFEDEGASVTCEVTANDGLGTDTLVVTLLVRKIHG